MSFRFAPGPSADSLEGDLTAAIRAQRERTFPRDAAPSLLAHGIAAHNLEKLLSGGVVAVTTGQQAGLFTGPLYTVLKGLTAAALAERLTAEHGVTAVPVFWVAGDDHDFAEINHCQVTGLDGKPVRLVLRERPSTDTMRSAFREAVGPDGAAALSALEAALPPSEFRSGTLDWLSTAYRSDHSVAEACAIALAELLGPFGVVVCRGWHGSLKAAAGPVLSKALREAAALDLALAEQAERLRASGHETPVEVGQRLSLVMLEGRAGRDRLVPVEEGRLRTRRGGEVFALSELEKLVATDPERLSANVLLRPAVESFVIPTVCYVGGPAELSYLRQAAPVFETVSAPRPSRASRLSGCIVEAKVDRTLERAGVSVQELRIPEGELASRLARDGLPAGLMQALERLRVSILEGYALLQSETVKVEKTLEKAVESSRNQALAGTHDIEKRLIHAEKRNAETLLGQLSRARELLYPGGHEQERVITVASFLARHGPSVLVELYTAATGHAARLLEAPSRQP